MIQFYTAAVFAVPQLLYSTAMKMICPSPGKMHHYCDVKLLKMVCNFAASLLSLFPSTTLNSQHQTVHIHFTLTFSCVEVKNMEGGAKLVGR